jgi:hypothetical protein
MKKLICLFLLLACLVGCQKPNDGPIPPQPQPQPQPNPIVLTEEDNGRTVLVGKGSRVTFSAKVNANEDYFWSVSKMDGDFEVITDTRVTTTKQNIVIECGSKGALEFTYNFFAPEGARVLSKISVKIELKEKHDRSQ